MADPDTLGHRLSTEAKIGSSPRGERLRLSLHAYNAEQDIDSLEAALKRML